MKTNLIFTLLACTLFLTTSCFDDSPNLNETGRLRVQMVDAPFPFDQVTEANVTVFKIDARLKEGEIITEDDEATDEDAEEMDAPFVVLMEEEIPLNLLDLVNGTTASLADLEVPAGTYDLVRVYVKGINVVLTDGTEYDLKVPSGAQTGIKVFINPGLTVVGGLSADLLLDFDVSKSFVAKGNTKIAGGINGFNFKPVIKASNMSTAGTLKGNVSTLVEETPLGLEGALVEIFNETDTLTTFSDIDGNYIIMGIPAGSYRITAGLETYVQSDTLSAEVNAANSTVQDFLLEAEPIVEGGN
ncbi:DUF4382 domain-containing protein [Maribacter aurantiacus]|uniref:DUF4382 domain-containing protein n=1 Tax=Maribacter aurantiacus TaxID=1882343 RepID=A0A5R8M443_9FLAO|nr:DUF4382 domain-containing protein [Maribacter aurantiacus]TLF44343.1 DUF4382 domain-containing protein [Maribacter aurantiacus]